MRVQFTHNADLWRLCHSWSLAVDACSSGVFWKHGEQIGHKRPGCCTHGACCLPQGTPACSQATGQLICDDRGTSTVESYADIDYPAVFVYQRDS